mmetsp:Transcript_24199/g.52178  ORF Transcript_24199/g.52178 Transcript_24199/m.52178 type:complete len:200 (+) Transcript_24199:609-1208(+)
MIILSELSQGVAVRLGCRGKASASGVWTAAAAATSLALALLENGVFSPVLVEVGVEVGRDGHLRPFALALVAARHHPALRSLGLLDGSHLLLRTNRDLHDAREPSVGILELRVVFLGRQPALEVCGCDVEAVLVIDGLGERGVARRRLLATHLLLNVFEHIRIDLLITLRGESRVETVALFILLLATLITAALPCGWCE